jgi:hypothetical protein
MSDAKIRSLFSMSAATLLKSIPKETLDIIIRQYLNPDYDSKSPLVPFITQCNRRKIYETTGKSLFYWLWKADPNLVDSMKKI